jgi:hypothetical protein
LGVCAHCRLNEINNCVDDHKKSALCWFLFVCVVSYFFPIFCSRFREFGKLSEYDNNYIKTQDEQSDSFAVWHGCIKFCEKFHEFSLILWIVYFFGIRPFLIAGSKKYTMINIIHNEHWWNINQKAILFAWIFVIQWIHRKTKWKI